jgi:hypothetical protein
MFDYRDFCGTQTAAFGAFYRNWQERGDCHKTVAAFFTDKEGFVAGDGGTDTAKRGFFIHLF